MPDVTKERLKKVPLASVLTKEQIDRLLPGVRVFLLSQGATLPAGDLSANYLFFVEKGKVVAEVTDPEGRMQTQRRANAGEYVGYMGLITGRPCGISITARKDAALLGLPLDPLHGMLLPRVRSRKLPKGEELFRQGQPADYLYYVHQGQVAETRADAQGREFVHRYAEPGEYLGRYSVLTGEPFQATATAAQSSEILEIPLRDLQPLLFAHENWRNWLFQNDIAVRLRAVPLVKDLDDWDIYLLADEVEVEEYEPGASIFQAGEEATHFYVVDQGQVAETPARGGQTRYLAAGNFFGLDSLQPKQRRRSTAVARKPARLFRMPGLAIRDLFKRRGKPLPTERAWTDLLARLRGVHLFSNLTDEQMSKLAGYVHLVRHRPGDVLTRQGEPATSLLILDEGEAVALRKTSKQRPRPVRTFKVHEPPASPPDSEYFGAHALLVEEMRGATVEVTEPSAWIVLERGDFRQFLADAGLSPSHLAPEGQRASQAAGPAPTPADRLPLPYWTRRHWIVPVTRVTPVVLTLIMLVILALFDVYSEIPTGLRVGLLVVSLVLLFVLAFWAVWRYLDWLNDNFEVTNEAVIHTEKVIFFSEERSQALLRQIQNVNLSTSALGQILGYGDVSIDTAALKGQVRFTTVPKPAYLQDLIQKAADEAKSGGQFEFRQSIRERLEDQLHPERLDATVPDSVLITPEPPPPRPPPRWSRFLSPRGWLPRFEIREDGRITWRKHWFNLVQRVGLAGLAVMAAAYILFAYALAFVTAAFGLPVIALPPVSWTGFQGWLFFLLLFLSSLTILWFVYQYTDWRNDVYIVTEDAVIDVERQLAVFPLWFIYTEDRRQASLANVQFVDFKVPNPIAVIFNYGDVIVQTAGAEGTLTFLFVSNPAHVHAEVMRRVQDFQDRQRRREFDERWGDMPQWFETYRDMMAQQRKKQGD